MHGEKILMICFDQNTKIKKTAIYAEQIRRTGDILSKKKLNKSFQIN